MSYEAKITAMGLALPPASKPVASYVMSTRVGNYIYTGARSHCSHFLDSAAGDSSPSAF